MNPGRNWLTVRDTEYALRHGSANLGSLPGLIRELLTADAWRHFVLPTGEEVKPKGFADFVAKEVPRGLESTVSMVKKIIESFEDEAERAELLDLLDRAVQGKHGGDHSKPDVIRLARDPNQHGTSRDGALRKLRKDAPELHAEVIAGRLSAHAAMVQAGFRPKTISVPVSRPESAAAALRRHLAPDDLAALARLLTDNT